MRFDGEVERPSDRGIERDLERWRDGERDLVLASSPFDLLKKRSTCNFRVRAFTAPFLWLNIYLKVNPGCETNPLV